LIKSNPEYKTKRNNLFRDFFKVDQSIEKVAESIRKFDVLCNNVNEKTGKNFDTFEIYYLILNDLGVDIFDFDSKKLQDFYNETEEILLLCKPILINSEISTVFSKIISENKTINILSNTAFIKGQSLRKVLEHYELSQYFAFQLYSDETGISKPNPQFFQKVYDEVLAKKSIEKSQIVHIGDNKIADYQGALQFGFSAILI
jgi:putative hydrolase of the HAD superfamily